MLARASLLLVTGLSLMTPCALVGCGKDNAAGAGKAGSRREEVTMWLANLASPLPNKRLYAANGLRELGDADPESRQKAVSALQAALAKEKDRQVRSEMEATLKALTAASP